MTDTQMYGRSVCNWPGCLTDTQVCGRSVCNWPGCLTDTQVKCFIGNFMLGMCYCISCLFVGNLHFLWFSLWLVFNWSPIFTAGPLQTITAVTASGGWWPVFSCSIPEFLVASSWNTFSRESET